MSRWLLALVASLAVTMIGCGGGGGGSGDATAPPTAPPDDPAAPPIDTPATPPAPPVTDGPLDPHTGAVILAGSRDAGAGKPSPVELTLDAKAGELALVELTASGTGGADREAIACLRTGTYVHGMMPVTASGTVQHFAQPVWNDGPLTLEIFNKPSMDGTPYVTPVTINYNWFVTAIDDDTEPANNTVYTSPHAPETELQQGSFKRTPDGSQQDTLDIYTLHLSPNRRYSLQFTNSNDRYGEWTYSVELVNNYWQSQFRHENITAADLTYLTFVPGPGVSYYQNPNNYYLKIMATPKNPSTEHLNYARYWFKFSSTDLDAPAITGLTPAVITGGTNDQVQIAAQLASPSFDPSMTYSWTFGDGALPATSTAQQPTVTFLAPGTYSGSVTVKNKSGYSTPHDFTYTVTRGTPRILSMSPTTPVSGLGLPIQFSTTALNEPTSFAWDFGPNATPATSTDASPSVEFTQAGQYQISVTATNELGTGIEYKHLLKVEPYLDAPVFTSVSVSGLYEGETVKFTPTCVNPGVITRWEWTFEGGLSGADTSVEKPQGTATTSGLYDGTVRAFNASGYGPTYPFTYAVEPDGLVHFNSKNVNSPVSTINEKQLFIRADGRPVVIYAERAGYYSDVLKMAQATSSAPNGTDDWVVHTLNNDVSLTGLAITEINGRLAVAYQVNTTEQLVVALAAVDVPASADDWYLVAVNPNRKLGEQPRLHVINGRLQVTTLQTIASGYYSSEYALVNLYASTDFPSAAEDWKTRTIAVPGTIDSQMTSTVLADRLAVVYTNKTKGLRLVRANTTIPDTDEDWDISTIANTPMGAMLSDVAVVNNRLITANIDWNTYRISLFAAQVAEPAGEADWRYVDLGATNITEGRPVIGEYDNRIVVVGPDVSKRLTAHYGPTDGTALGAWTSQVVRQQAGIGNFPALTTNNGHLWIAANLQVSSALDRVILLQGTTPQ